MRILEQGPIRSVADVSRLNIIDWGRANGLWRGDVAVPLQIVGTSDGAQDKRRYYRKSTRPNLARPEQAN